jgi:putative nucleotidyltransferase with HDIG domain
MPAPLRDIPRLLLIEDEEPFALLLKEYLTMEGFSVALAREGGEAIELYHRKGFDLVLSDLELPGMKGLELLRRLRAEPRPPVVVLISGFGTMETAITAMREGAYDYLPKPFRLEDLSLTLKRAYEHKRLSDENIQLRESLALYQLSMDLNATRSLPELREVLRKFILQTFPCDLYFFLLRGEEGSWVVSDHYDPQGRYSSPQEIIESFYKPELIKRFIQMESLFFADGEPPLVSSHRIFVPRSGMIVPATYQGRILGALGIFRDPPHPPFTPGERKTMEIIGSRTALSLENMNLIAHLEETFLASIQGFVNAIEARDGDTRGHSERVARWAILIGTLLHLPQEELEILRRGALLHDIGKIGVRTDFLFHKDGLDPREYEEFKHHTIIGKRILEPIPFLKPVLDIVYLHHERWDGTGYPLGLKGEEIPLRVRIVTLADALDVMTYGRSYRQAYSLDRVKEELSRCAGTQFDPRLVELVLDYLRPHSHLEEVPLPSSAVIRRGEVVLPPVLVPQFHEL